MTCPPIISRETFDLAQKALKERKAASGRPTKHPYLLQGKLFCRRCGSRFYVDIAHGVPLYKCGSRVKARYSAEGPSHEGVKIRWRAEELDARVKRFVEGILNRPERLLEEADAWELLADQADKGDPERERLQALLDGLDARRDRVTDLREAGEITHDDTVKRLHRIEAERSKVMADLRAIQDSPPSGDIYREFAAWLRDCAAGRDKLDVDREDIDRLIERIWVEDSGELRIEGKTTLSSHTVRLPATCTVAL